MKRFVAFALLVVTGVTTHAQVFPSPVFGTFAPWEETYDALPTGSFISFPIWGGNGTAARLLPANALVVTNAIGAFSVPNAMTGRGADVNIKVNTPMTRFGGWFKNTPWGITVTTATFNFYDSFNVLIGSVTAPITPAWNWIGWSTIPAWQRVEVIGNGSLPGYISFDNTRCRP